MPRKGRKPKRLYKLHQRTLNSQDFGSPQMRKRFYVVGMRKDIGNSFRQLKMPASSLKCQRAKQGIRRAAPLITMLRRANDCQQVEDADLNHTELRNWKAVQERLASPLTRFPVVADFHMCTAFGTSLQEEASPTITKTRARGKACWLIDKVQKGSFGKVLAKRRQATP